MKSFSLILSVTLLFVVTSAFCLSDDPPKPQTTAQQETVDRVKTVLNDPAAIQLLHQYFSTTCFNKCWDLINKPSRTEEEVEQMIALSQTSFWHWIQRKDCKPVNLSIAYWQLGRVYCLAGLPETAKRYGKKCIAVSQKNKLPPFYLGYGYEVMALAGLLEKDFDTCRKYLTSAEEQLALVKNPNDKKMLEADLTKIRNTLKLWTQKKDKDAAS